jgi:hypothetical protein
MFKLLKMMFGPTPRWIKDVESHGKAAQAVILSDPKEILKGVAGYEGRDGWIDVQAQVQPAGDVPFEARMKCRLSQAVFGMLEIGMTVNVRYDPENKSRVLLVDDVNALLRYREIPET